MNFKIYLLTYGELGSFKGSFPVLLVNTIFQNNFGQKFVLPVFNRNFSRLLEFFLTYFGNLLDFLLIYVWWSLDNFWRKKNADWIKEVKKTIKNYLLLPHHHPILLFEIWLYYVPKQQNVFFFFFVFIEYTRKHTLLDQ